MPYTINNPGGGDCGFYAFTIGLLDIIQQEYKLHGESRTFNLWQKEGLNGVSLHDILNINLNSLYQSPRKYQKDLLFTLQMSLRTISVNVTKFDLFNSIKTELMLNEGQTKVEGSTVYFKFMELVQFYLKRNGTLKKISQFNELALSPEVLQLAQQTAKSLQKKLKGQPFDVAQRIENSFVKKVLLQDVMHDDQFNADSVILKGTDLIKEQGRWATHDDLKEIAAQLDVNLHVIGKINGALTPDYPTVTLNNQSNAHWTTSVEQLPQPQKAAKSSKKAPTVEPVASEKRKRPADAQPLNALNSDSGASEETQHPKKKKPKPSVVQKQEQTLSMKEQQVIAASVSSQIQEDKVDRYREHLKNLVHASSTLGLFAHVTNKIDVNAIDSAEAALNELGEKESDESFAIRLQEAELRRVKLK